MYCEGRDKPYFRGVFHAIGVVFLIPYFISSILSSIDDKYEILSFLLFIIGNGFCWILSSLFHCMNWSLNTEIIMQRLDHSAIFINVACTYSSVAILLLKEMSGYELYFVHATICIVCCTCLFGALRVLYRTDGDTTTLVVHTAALSFPSYLSLGNHMNRYEVCLGLSGLSAYAVGAYIFKNYHNNIFKIVPKYIENHELFHALTVVSTICLFLMHSSLYQ